jgi:hypothetical protein
MVTHLRERLARWATHDHINASSGLQQRTGKCGVTQVSMHDFGPREIELVRSARIRVNVTGRNGFKALQPKAFGDATSSSEKVNDGRTIDWMHKQD